MEVRNLIRKILREDFDWVKDVPEQRIPTVEGQKLRVWWDNDEWLGAFEDREIYSGDIFTFSGNMVFDDPDDEGIGTVYHFYHPNLNDQTISVPLDPNFIEPAEEEDTFWRPQRFNLTYELVMNESNDFDWTKEVKPMSMTNLYVIDTRNLSYKDVVYLLEDLRELGYLDTSQVPDTADYIYMEYEDGRFFVDWADDSLSDPTYGGDYQMIDVDMFNEMFYNWKIERDTGSLFKENLDWISEVGKTRDQILDDLETRIKTMDWDVDLERDHEWTTDMDGYFFGRFWCGRGLFELYEYGDTYTIRMYSREVNYRGHMEYEHFNSEQGLTPKELMSKITSIIVNCLDAEKQLKNF